MASNPIRCGIFGVILKRGGVVHLVSYIVLIAEFCATIGTQQKLPLFEHRFRMCDMPGSTSALQAFLDFRGFDFRNF